MSTVKEDIQALLQRLPDDCTLEDVPNTTSTYLKKCTAGSRMRRPAE